MPIYEFEGRRPFIDPQAWVAPSADLIGDVQIGPQCYVGWGAILRARVIIDEGIQASSMDRINGLMLIMLGILIVQSLAMYGRHFILEVAALRVTKRIRTWLFGSIVSQEMSFFDEQTTGDLTARLSNDINHLNTIMRELAPEFIHFFLVGVSAAALMVYTSPILSAVVVVVGPLMWVATSVLGRFMQRQGGHVQTRNAELFAAGLETLSGIQTVRVYHQEQAEVDRYDDAGTRLVAAYKRHIHAYSLLRSFTTLITESAVLMALWVGGMLIVRNDLTSGALVTFILYAALVLRSVRNVSHAGAEVLRAQGATDRILTLGERIPGISLKGGRIPEDVVGNISLEDVHFSYPTRPDNAALHGVSLEISQGENVAFVGGSGSGKSTIAKLIARLYDPVKGRVLLDGHDLREIDPSWLREHVTLVPAEPTLFTLSVADNIRFGRPEASDAEVEKAAQISHAVEFIERLPDGYQTEVGDSGRLFSSGQRQRIAIARAVLRKPRIMILDEATSALDSEGEALVKDSLLGLPGEPTIITVSHRLSTIVAADRVVLLCGGRLEAMGTHDELLVSSATYGKLIEDQIIGE